MTAPLLLPGQRASFPHHGKRVEGTVFTPLNPRGQYIMALYDGEGGVEYVYVWAQDAIDAGPSIQDEQPAVYTDEALEPQSTDSIPTELLYPAGGWVCALTGGLWQLARVVAHGQAIKRGRLSEGQGDRVTVQVDETLEVISLHRDQVRPAPVVDQVLGKPRVTPTAAPAPVQPQPDLGPLFGGLS